MTDVTLKKMLYTLCVVKGISGDETKASEMALSFLKKYCPDAHLSHGNVMEQYVTERSTSKHGSLTVMVPLMLPLTSEPPKRLTMRPP